jgi:aromatic ring-cleaving dioxygenase
MHVEGYHAHIYFPSADPASGAAYQQRVRERFGDLVAVGRFHDHAIGPHPISMFQVAFPAGHLEELFTWLIENREGRSVLIHPITGNDLVDHRDHALWLGAQLPLNLEFLEKLEQPTTYNIPKSSKAAG